MTVYGYFSTLPPVPSMQDSGTTQQWYRLETDTPPDTDPDEDLTEDDSGVEEAEESDDA